jgi:hypothetical protein
MKTAMQQLIEYLEKDYYINELTNFDNDKLQFLEKEKEQIQKAFSDGQETPINHPNLPHYSREEYYNDNYNQNK